MEIEHERAGKRKKELSSSKEEENITKEDNDTNTRSAKRIRRVKLTQVYLFTT